MWVAYFLSTTRVNGIRWQHTHDLAGTEPRRHGRRWPNQRLHRTAPPRRLALAESLSNEDGQVYDPELVDGNDGVPVVFPSVSAWRSSGMSGCFPHFYCTRCSNVIHREADKLLAWNRRDAAVVDEIAATLPECPCGGRFAPGANPKCRYCGHEFLNDAPALIRLDDPHIIVMNGACFFGDRGPYRVRIHRLPW